MTIGNRIKKLRKEKGLNQTILGNIVGLTFSGISSIESNKSNPSSDVIIKLSNYFDVSADYLLKGIEIERTISENEQEVIEIMRGDEDFKKAVTQAAESKKKAINYLGGYTHNHAHAA